MAEAKAKSWVTETSVVTVVAGILEAASQFLTGNSILPEPWSGVVIAGLGFLTLVLRTVDKQKGAA